MKGANNRWLEQGDDALDRLIAERIDSPVPEAPAPRPPRKRRVRTVHIPHALYLALALLLCLGIIGALMQTTARLPSFGNPDNPTNNEVSRRYLEQGLDETGAVNLVAGMILDYRAFDTLGESNVLFVAICAVIILLRLQQGEARPDDTAWEPRHDLILRTVGRLVVPLVLVFGIYVILNGHLSPGGGFSGGAVIGAGLILCRLAEGGERMGKVLSFRTFRTLSTGALSFYALSKAYSFFTGANRLPSVITPGVPGRIFSAGLIPYLNIAVGLVVACTMYALFTLFRKGDL